MIGIRTMKIIKIKHSFQDRFYCIASNEFDFFDFIKRIRNHIHAIEGSFAFNYSLRIITRLFQYADDLRKTYNEYYKSEYDSFEFYLYQKELIDKNMLSMLYIDENHTILRLNPSLNSYNTLTLFDDDGNNIELINEILEKIYK